MIQYFPRSLSRIKYCSSPWNITLDRTETKKLRNNNITRYGNLNSSLVSVLRYILIYGREKKNDVKSVYFERENIEDGDSPSRGISCRDMFNCNNKEREGSWEWLSGEWWSHRRHDTWPSWQVGTWHVSHVTEQYKHHKRWGLSIWGRKWTPRINHYCGTFEPF